MPAWMLTDEGQRKCLLDTMWEDADNLHTAAMMGAEAGSQAQAHKIAEWGEEVCEEHKAIALEDGMGYSYQSRHDCSQCWAEFRNEAGVP